MIKNFREVEEKSSEYEESKEMICKVEKETEIKSSDIF